MSNFEIVARERFLRRHVPAGDPPPADGESRATRPVRHRHGDRARRAHPADDRRLRSRQGNDHAGHPGGRARRRARCSGIAGSAARSYAMVGPMGVPSPIGHAKKVLCVGGGLGVAPMFPQARAFQEAGAYVIGVIGFRNKDLDVLGRQVPHGVRRGDRVHRRRFGRHQGHRHRGHPAGDRASIPTSTNAWRSARRS